jgi:hypothetical protein
MSYIGPVRVPDGITKGNGKFKVSFAGWKEKVALANLEVPIKRLLEVEEGAVIIPAD